MIVKYILNSPLFEGKAVFGFEDDYLSYFSNESNMNATQKVWLLQHIPITQEALKELKERIKGQLTQVPEDLSFEAFWNAYEKKVNKKRCEPLWEKLKDADRLEVLLSIKPYNGYLARSNGRAKLDPENYLKRESWTTNWNTIKA